MGRFLHFLEDEAGAVTVDFLAIVAASLLMGLMLVYSIFSNGVAVAGTNISCQLASISLDISLGDPFEGHDGEHSGSDDGDSSHGSFDDGSGDSEHSGGDDGSHHDSGDDSEHGDSEHGSSDTGCGGGGGDDDGEHADGHDGEADGHDGEDDGLHDGEREFI